MIYKVLEVKNMRLAEEKMNEMAKYGWEVVTVTYWQSSVYRLIITFKKEN